MTSTVPLHIYNQHGPREYTDDFDSSPARKNTLSYVEGQYDPYADTPGKSWGNTASAESATDLDVTQNPSLSYDSKALSKWFDQLVVNIGLTNPHRRIDRLSLDTRSSY